MFMYLLITSILFHQEQAIFLNFQIFMLLHYCVTDNDGKTTIDVFAILPESNEELNVM